MTNRGASAWYVTTAAAAAVGLVAQSIGTAGVRGLGTALTGIVDRSVFRGLHKLVGLSLFADVILHTVVPVLGAGGWLLFGPRRPVSLRAILVAVAFPNSAE